MKTHKKPTNSRVEVRLSDKWQSLPDTQSEIRNKMFSYDLVKVLFQNETEEFQEMMFNVITSPGHPVTVKHFTAVKTLSNEYANYFLWHVREDGWTVDKLKQEVKKYKQWKKNSS